MLKPLVIWGAKGHAKVLAEFTEALGYQLVAVFDNATGIAPPFSDVPLHYGVEGFKRWLRETTFKQACCLVAIGGDRGSDRVRMQRLLESHKLTPITAVHPTAFVARSATLGKGTQVLAKAALCVEVQLGEACIINTAATVDHESVLGHGVHVGPGAILAGCVTVGDFSFIGTGAVLLPRVRIGRNVTIGAGAVVTTDVPDNTVAYGVPARVVHEKKDSHAEL